MLRANRFGLFALALVFSFCSFVLADEEAVAGREVLSKYQNSVVTVKLVIKQGISLGGREVPKTEEKSEISGTVIDPSGLTLISLSATEPAQVMKSFMRGPEMYGEEYENMKMEFKSELSEVKLILHDGAEVDAKIVLRDKDRDIAFVRPKEKLAKPLNALDLKNAASPQILERVIILNRLGKIVDRAATASVGRIMAVVEKPTKFYILGDESMWGGLGSPVFTLEGKIVGVVLLRMLAQSGSVGFSSMFSVGRDMPIMPYILPAEDILKASQEIGRTKKTKPQKFE